MAENMLSNNILARLIKYKDSGLSNDSARLKITRLGTYLETVSAERSYTKPLFGVDMQILFLNNDTRIIMKPEQWCLCYNTPEEINDELAGMMMLELDQVRWLFNNPLTTVNSRKRASFNIKVETKGLGCHISTYFSKGLFIPVEEMKLMATYYHIFYRLPRQLARNRRRLQ